MSDRDARDWPELDHELVTWDVHPVTGMTRRDRNWTGRDYKASIVPTIADRTPTISAEVLADVEEAAGAMVRLDTEMGAHLSPYTAVLLRSEAASSSQIEGITAGARAIAEAEATGHGSGNAELIVANTGAMTEALNVSGALDIARILAMHNALLAHGDPEIAGRIREDAVWIGSGGTPHTAEFVPPVAERVESALADLASFMDRDDLPVLVLAAITHAQFETIHPFSDGNGRTGRALLHAVVTAKGLVRHAAIPVSAGLLVRRGHYIDALTAYRAGDPNAIVSELAKAGLLAADEGRALALAVQAVRLRWAEELSGVRSDSAAHRLADGLVRHPVITVHQAREVLGSQDNVHRHIEVLVRAGILTPKQDYRTRDMIWRAQDVLDELDGYARRIGRRVR